MEDIQKGYAGHLFILYHSENYLPDFSLQDQLFLPRAPSLFMHLHFLLNKIDLTPFSSCCPSEMISQMGHNVIQKY